MVSNKQKVREDRRNHDTPTLPSQGRLPINHCNLPAVILGSLTFHRHPAPLLIDGVLELHSDLFRRMHPCAQAQERADQFKDYMTVYFGLNAPDRIGLEARSRLPRPKADYLHMLRGWLFDSDGQEAAVLKGWVESRFGLLPRYHKGAIPDADAESYRVFMHERARGLYNTNALEAQLDLLYTYCQYELTRQYPDRTHIELFRGQNRVETQDLLWQKKNRLIVILNNLNSFTTSRERADEFGDRVLKTDVPLARIFFFNGLLPGLLQGEDEYLVLGGVHELQICP